MNAANPFAPYLVAVVAATLLMLARRALSRHRRKRQMPKAASFDLPSHSRRFSFLVDDVRGVREVSPDSVEILHGSKGEATRATEVRCGLAEAVAAIFHARYGQTAEAEEKPSRGPLVAFVSLSPGVMIRPEAVAYVQGHKTLTSVHTKEGHILFIEKPVEEVARLLGKGVALV